MVRSASARHLIPTHEVSPCLQERGYKGADSDCKQAFAVIQDVPVGFDAQQAHHQALQPRDTMHTLTAKASHSVAYQCQGSNVGPMGTLRAGNGNATGGVPFVASSVGSKWAVRRLMPIECERCQGFPDNWTAQGVDEAGNVVEISDSQRYRMIGNSVSPPNAEWIMRRIVEVA